jgi:ankyrin repeat protein
VKLLISLGAREYPSDKYPYFARSAFWALMNKNTEMARLLLDAGADPNLFTTAVDYSLPIDIMRALLDHKAGANHLGDDGLRPLHSAAGHNRLDVMQLLLDRGAEVDAPTTATNGLGCGMRYYEGDTALHIAIENKCLSAAEFLLKHGAKADIRNKYGETPLHYAVGEVAVDPEIGLQAVRLLVQHHADVNAIDKEGTTPLDRASPDFFNAGLFDDANKASERFAATVEFLKKHGALTSKQLAKKDGK